MGRAKADRSQKGDGTVEAADGSSLKLVAMVKGALEDLGPDAMPQALQDYIRTKYNREVSKGIISNYKSTFKRNGSMGGTATAPNGRGRPRIGAGHIRYEDLETVSGLVHRLGAEQVRRLVAVMAGA